MTSCWIPPHFPFRCCGDMHHFDLGVWAFKKFADPGKGVVGIQYRAVPCPGSGSGSGSTVEAMGNSKGSKPAGL